MKKALLFVAWVSMISAPTAVQAEAGNRAEARRDAREQVRETRRQSRKQMRDARREARDQIREARRKARDAHTEDAREPAAAEQH